MNIFGFRPFKGKFNLGNSDDIPENQDGTLIGSIKQIKSALGEKEDVLPTTATKSNIAEITTFSSAKKSFTIPLNAKYLRVSIKLQDVWEQYSPFIPVEIVKAGLMASELETITFASKNPAYQLNLYYFLAPDGITPYRYESGGNLAFQRITVYAY